MAFDFDLTCNCDHVVDGIQYWGFDLMSDQEQYFLENDSTFKQKFLKQMVYSICPRCNGRGWYYDFHFSKNDAFTNAATNPVTVRSRAKFRQETTKFLMTVMGDNIFHPLYGIGYFDFIGTKINDSTEDLLRIATINGLEYLRALFVQQKTYQDVGAEEVFTYISDLQVTYDLSAPTTFYINISVYNEASSVESIDYTKTVEQISGLPMITSDMTSLVTIQQ